MTDKILAWHFCTKDRRLGYGDNREIAAGETLSVDPPIALCERGLHGSIKPLDALRYAPGNIITRVELFGEKVSSSNKIVATHRRTIWIADAKATLLKFRRWCALQVIDLWNAPPIVYRYLISGQEQYRNAAYAAASAAYAASVVAYAATSADDAASAASAAAYAASVVDAASAASAAAYAASVVDAVYGAHHHGREQQNTKLTCMLEKLAPEQNP